MKKSTFNENTGIPLLIITIPNCLLAMDGRAEKVSTGWERCEGVILLNFNTPCIFPFVGLKSVAYAHGYRR
jgi:hypothetical protein